MAFLTPDRTYKVNFGSNDSFTVNVKIIPDGARADKKICSYIDKGDLVKPNKKLNDGTGKPKGITVHNTDNIKAATGTNSAEQYARATYPNGNMKGVVVHYWVYKDVVWQQLADNERGWHAADGSSRRSSRRSGQKIGGNIDTIAIESIETGSDKVTEATTAKLVAYLCDKYGLDPSIDVYTHNYFYPEKYCPVYILPHWDSFIGDVKSYYNKLRKAETPAAKPENKPVQKPEQKPAVIKNIGGNDMTRGYFMTGDRNEGVYMLKQCLMVLKSAGVITQGVDDNNIFGDGTKKAVKQVQKAAKITQDGYAGPQTISAIRKLINAKVK